MKKVLVVVCILVLAMGTLAGCGSSDKDSSKGSSLGSESSTGSDSSKEKSSEASDTALLEEYIEQSKPTIDAMMESMKDVAELTVTAEGSNLVYTFTYKVDVGDLELAKKQMDSAMESQRASMEAVVKALEVAGISNPGVISRYINSDGAEIATYTF